MKKPLLILLPLTVLAGPLLLTAALIAFVAGGHADCDTDPGGSELPAVHVDPASVPVGPVAGYGREQLVNAAHIMLAAREKGLSLRDQRIGVMTAMGESSLRVLDHGDTAGPDSRGLFQQRDSWGSLADRMDPYKSSVLFFNAMVEVEGREDLEPTIVAHRTQRNADPYHYRPYWAPAGEVVDALGQVRANDTVPVSNTTGDPYHLGQVRPQLRALVNVLAPMFGIERVGGYRPSATDPNGHPAGLAADFMVPMDADGKRRGDALAAYAQAHAEELAVDYMIWRQRIWSVARADEGWRPMEDRGSPTQNHFDHVHINVEANASNVPISTVSSNPECDLLAVGYTGTWVKPVDSDRITDDYGPGSDPFGGTRFHTGVDWGAPCGTPVKAASDGTVVKAGPADSIYGQQVVIDHGNDIDTMYGHMYPAGVIVQAGDQVSAGQRIGEVGSAGRSTGCHLHFEVRIGGKHTDPIKFLANPPAPAGNGGRILSLNTLGCSHTGPGGDQHPTWADCMERIPKWMDYIEDRGVGIAGLQEVTYRTHRALKRRYDHRWGLYPARYEPDRQNPIIWDTRHWSLVSGDLYPFPYNSHTTGHLTKVLLRHRNGQLIYVFNTHNTSERDGYGNWAREESLQREVRHLKEVAGRGIPIVFVGDFNDVDRPHCVLTPELLRSAFGKGKTSPCRAPRAAGIDQIFYTGVQVTKAETDRSLWDREVVDHPAILTDITGGLE